MVRDFGNIDDVLIKDAINDPQFQVPWKINKDQIDVCKDCEFRYICSDCRAYLASPENSYSKPAKCSCNPYTGTWEDSNKISSL